MQKLTLHCMRIRAKMAAFNLVEDYLCALSTPVYLS